jgi:hypothetical protein
MIKYYLRPDQALIRIDEENMIATNVLLSETHNFIGHNTNADYVESMIAMANNNILVLSDEETFNTAKAEVITALSAI